MALECFAAAMTSVVIFLSLFEAVKPLEKTVNFYDLDDYPGFPEAWNKTEEILTKASISGLMLTVVQHGEDGESYKVWSKGYGRPDLARPEEPYDFEGTLLPIGSVSKSFAVTLLGILLTEQRQLYPLGWSTRVKDILGQSFSFRTSVEDVVTLRHLLSHTTGTFSHQPGLTMGLDRRLIQDYCRRMKFLEGSDEMGEFSYNNLMYMLAECVVVKIGGDSYANLLKRKLFGPLGMAKSTLIGQPEVTNFDGIHRMYYKNETSSSLVEMDIKLLNLAENLHAAGGVLASGADMSRYVMFHLEKGRTLEGRQLLDPHLWNETHTSQLAATRNNSASLDYGMGWFLETSRDSGAADLPMSIHGGRIAGYDSEISLEFDKKFGVFTSGNGPAYQSHRHQKTVHAMVYGLLLNVTLRAARSNPSGCHYPHHPATARVNSSEAYRGAFGNGFFGNFTVTDGRDKENQSTLHFRYGQFGRGLLLPLNETTFVPAMEGPLDHYHHTAGAESYTFTAAFSDADQDGSFNTLHVIYRGGSIQFERGLRWQNREPAATTTASSSSTANRDHAATKAPDRSPSVALMAALLAFVGQFNRGN